MNSRKLVVCFAGKIGSGKTTTSRAIADTLHCGYASFGVYLRTIAEELGQDPGDRNYLQDLGQSLISENPVAFCKSVLNSGGFVPGKDFVLDGIRHVEVLEPLAQLVVPSELCLIFLHGSERTRRARVKNRSYKDWTDFNRRSKHVVEEQLRVVVPQRADIVLDTSSLDEQEVRAKCIVEINNFRNSGQTNASPKGFIQS